jgi:GTPase involved in cell partitioning and DNA repair
MNKFQKALEKRKEEERRRREEERAKRESAQFLNTDVPSERPAARNDQPNFQRHIKHADVDQSIVALHDPRSSVAEQYRTLRTNLKSYDEKKSSRQLLSQVPRPGRARP